MSRQRKVLNDGFVRLVDRMGDDSAIVQAARVSYGAGTKSYSEDKALIRYLMRNYHTTPFEMVELKFHLRVPMDCWRQYIRHRTASVNEYSTRYSEAIDSCQTTKEWRLQGVGNKQGSFGLVAGWPSGYEVTYKSGSYHVMCPNGTVVGSWDHEPTPAEYLTFVESKGQESSRDDYEERLLFGVAREQARKDLPLSTYTEAYWKIDLHNLFHFLKLRLDSHAQYEIRQYAKAIFCIIDDNEGLNAACRAFEDYRLNAIMLSGPEIAVLRGEKPLDSLSKREQEEYKTKLIIMGLKDDKRDDVQQDSRP